MQQQTETPLEEN